MHRHQLGVCLSAVLLVFGIAGGASSIAATANIVGWVVDTQNASLGGIAISRGETILSGQRLEVGRGGRVLLDLGTGNRMMLRENTVVSFERAANQVNATISLGEVAISEAKDHAIQVHVKYGQTSVTPVSGSYTSGKVLVTKQTMSVATKEGSLRVEAEGRALEVPKGREATLTNGSAQTAPALEGSVLRESVAPAESEHTFTGSKPEDFDCDKDDRTASPHKPPKCEHD